MRLALLPLLLPLLALAPLPEEETNPKGHKPPNPRRAKLVNIEKLDWNRGLEGDEVEARTYRDPKSGKRFKTYGMQNNIFRFDLGVKKDQAETALLDRDGDGLFESKLPFGEAKKKIPEWVMKTILSPQKILNKARIPVVREARLLQKSAIQRDKAGATLPVVVLFFEEETKPPKKEAQFHPSVAGALMLEKLAAEFDKRARFIGFRIEPQPKKQMTQTLSTLNQTLGSSVKKLPTFCVFVVLEGVDKSSRQKIFTLKQRKKLPLKIEMREEMENFEKRLSKETRDVLRKAEK